MLAAVVVELINFFSFVVFSKHKTPKLVIFFCTGILLYGALVKYRPGVPTLSHVCGVLVIFYEEVRSHAQDLLSRVNTPTAW